MRVETRRHQDEFGLELFHRRNEGLGETCEETIVSVPGAKWYVQRCSDASPLAALRGVAGTGIQRHLMR